MNMTCADAVLRETRIFSANNMAELMPAIVTKTSAATGISGITEMPIIVMVPDSAGLNVICTVPSSISIEWLRICVSPRKTWSDSTKALRHFYRDNHARPHNQS